MRKINQKLIKKNAKVYFDFFCKEQMSIGRNPDCEWQRCAQKVQQCWTQRWLDALVDALVCWGDADKIAAHVREHLDAGANHVCIQAFRNDGGLGADRALLEDLAKLLA